MHQVVSEIVSANSQQLEETIIWVGYQVRHIPYQINQRGKLKK